MFFFSFTISFMKHYRSLDDSNHLRDLESRCHTFLQACPKKLQKNTEARRVFQQFKDLCVESMEIFQRPSFLKTQFESSYDNHAISKKSLIHELQRSLESLQYHDFREKIYSLGLSPHTCMELPPLHFICNQLLSTDLFL